MTAADGERLHEVELEAWTAGWRKFSRQPREKPACFAKRSTLRAARYFHGLLGDFEPGENRDFYSIQDQSENDSRRKFGGNYGQG